MGKKNRELNRYAKTGLSIVKTGKAGALRNYIANKNLQVGTLVNDQINGIPNKHAKIIADQFAQGVKQFGNNNGYSGSIENFVAQAQKDLLGSKSLQETLANNAKEQGSVGWFR